MNNTYFYENSDNYKPCYMKQYDCYVCLPEEGTIVVNKLTNPELVCRLGKKDYITVADRKRLNNEQIGVLRSFIVKGQAQITTKDEPFVLAGTRGELSVVSPMELASNYSFLQGSQCVQINNINLNQRKSGDYLNWTLVRKKGLAFKKYFACFVPANKRFSIGNMLVNTQGVSHGKGDFLVCDSFNNKPNLTNRWLVNGEVFALTYNNQGWQDKIKSNLVSVTIDELPKLVSTVSDNKDYFKEFDIFYNLFKYKISSIVDVLEDKVYKNSNKSLRVNGDNDDYLVLSFKLDKDKVMISGTSDKKQFRGSYLVTSESDANTAVDDVLKTLVVSPLRREIKKLPEYFKSRGSKYKCSVVRFKSSKDSFIFKFIINNELQFTYSVNVVKGNVLFLHVRDKSNKALSYNFHREAEYSADKLYEQVDFVFTQENSSWKGVFSDLQEMFRSCTGFDLLTVNKGEGYFYFHEKAKDKKKYLYMLTSYDESSYTFKCVDHIKREKVLSDKPLVLEKGLRGTALLNKVHAYTNDLTSTGGSDLLKELKKSRKDFDDLVYSDKVRGIKDYYSESITANFLYVLFTTTQEVHDDGNIHALSLHSGTFTIFEKKAYCYSFDEDTYIVLLTDIDGHKIILTNAKSISYLKNYDEEYRSTSEYDGEYYDYRDSIRGIEMLFSHINDRDGESLNFDLIYDLGSQYLDYSEKYETGINDISAFFSNLESNSCYIDVPSILKDMYDYDFKFDFWFSPERISDFLDDCIHELQNSDKLSDDTIFELKMLVNAPNSKVRVKSIRGSLELVEGKAKSSLEVSKVGKYLSDISDLFQY